MSLYAYICLERKSTYKETKVGKEKITKCIKKIRLTTSLLIYMHNILHKMRYNKRSHNIYDDNLITIIMKYRTCDNFFIVYSFSFHSLTEVWNTSDHTNTALEKREKK